jgi:Na+/melibiose symporter-like transporter
MKPDLVLKITLLVAAFASFVLSVTLYFQADADDIAGRLNGIYVGIWVPSILALGAFILAGDRRKTP